MVRVKGQMSLSGSERRQSGGDAQSQHWEVPNSSVLSFGFQQSQLRATLNVLVMTGLRDPRLCVVSFIRMWIWISVCRFEGATGTSQLQLTHWNSQGCREAVGTSNWITSQAPQRFRILLQTHVDSSTAADEETTTCFLCNSWKYSCVKKWHKMDQRDQPGCLCAECLVMWDKSCVLAPDRAISSEGMNKMSYKPKCICRDDSKGYWVPEQHLSCAEQNPEDRNVTEALYDLNIVPLWADHPQITWNV